MWNLPRPELEPVSPASAGGFLTTGPPGKSQEGCLQWTGCVGRKLLPWQCEGQAENKFLAGPLTRGKEHEYSTSIMRRRRTLYWCQLNTSCRRIVFRSKFHRIWTNCSIFRATGQNGCCAGAHLFSHVQLFTTPWTVAHRFLCAWDSPGKNTRVSCHALLQGTFLIQGSNPRFLCLLHWQEDSLLAPPGKPPPGWWEG